MKNALFLLLPASALLYFPLAFEEFESPKAFALIAFGCFAAFWVRWRRILTEKLAFWLFIFTISAAVSAYFSIDVHMSVFGNTKCRAGLLVIASYLVFYLAASERLTDQSDAKEMIDIILGSSAIVAIYAIAQILGYDFKQWNGTLSEAGYTRPISFLGHPNFVANYLGMTLPFALWRMNDLRPIWKKLLCAVLALASITGIWFSLSRGMIIASAVGLFVYFIHSKTDYKQVISFLLILIAIISVSFLAFPVFRGTALIRMGALVSPGSARIEYPKAAIRIWKRSPWIGIGTDAFEIGFQNQRTPYYWGVERGGSPHRAHNDFLNTLATQGIFGALAATLLTLTLFFRIRKSRSPFVAPATAAIVVFYVAGLTSFAVVATGVLFLLCASLLQIEERKCELGV